MFAACRDERGFVKVNAFLQIEGYPNIFACGDVASIREEKLAQNAENSASVVIHNCIRSFIHNKPHKLKQYKPVLRPMIISLGKYDGYFLFGKWNLPGIIPALMKVVVELKVMTAYKFQNGLNFFL